MKNEATKQRLYDNLGSDYFWFSGHYALAGMLFERFRPEGGTFLLNIGCGPNEFTPASETMRYIGADFSFEACRLAKTHSPHESIVCCDAQALPFKNGSIDAVIALELLEHLEDDRCAAREFRRILDRRGIALVSVPAYMFLWGSHDVWNRHFRRYRAKTVRELADGTGLRIVYQTFYKIPFVIPLFLFRRLKQLFGASESSHDFVPVPQLVNTLLRRYLLCEANIARILPLPAGVSLFTILTPRNGD